MATTEITTDVDQSRVGAPRRRSTLIKSTRTAVTDAAGTAAGLAAEAASRLPDAVITTRAAFDDANRRIHASSDEMLRLGTAVTFGFAAGLLLGGATRIMVAVALAPVAMIGLTLLERSSRRAAPEFEVPGRP